jgi:protein-S-isoprenylcysteine O-methyltransferase Ste14
MTKFIQRGGLWVLSQALLLLAAIFLGLRFRGNGGHPVSGISGGILLAAGASIALAGGFALGRTITPFPEPSTQAQLVRSGIFSAVRHPIYAGLVVASTGWALFWRSWPALLMALGLLPFLDAKARREEEWLRERFPEYREYEASVKRFVPGIY